MQFTWATPEWFEEVVRSGNRLPPTPGVALSSEYTITDTPAGTLKYVERIRDGKIAEVFQGEDEAADFKISMPYQDYRRMIVEFLSSSDFESCTVVGDFSKFAPLAPIRTLQEYHDHRRHVVIMTTWP